MIRATEVSGFLADSVLAAPVMHRAFADVAALITRDGPDVMKVRSTRLGQGFYNSLWSDSADDGYGGGEMLIAMRTRHPLTVKSPTDLAKYAPEELRPLWTASGFDSTSEEFRRASIAIRDGVLADGYDSIFLEGRRTVVALRNEDMRVVADPTEAMLQAARGTQ